MTTIGLLTASDSDWLRVTFSVDYLGVRVIGLVILVSYSDPQQFCGNPLQQGTGIYSEDTRHISEDDPGICGYIPEYDLGVPWYIPACDLGVPGYNTRV